MALQLCKTITNLSSATTTSLQLSRIIPISLSSRIISPRSFSTKAQLVEIDLDSSSDGGAGEIEVIGGLKKLEDAIHSIVARRLAPDWLPFRPGASYWVPPKPSTGSIVEIVGKLTNPLTQEESLSFTSARGWPCSSFFIEGPISKHSIPMEVEVQVHVTSSPQKTSLSEDED